MCKPKPMFLHFFLLILLSIGFFACNQPTEQLLPELEGIEVDTESLMNAYDIEDFSMQGILLILYYDDGTTEKIPITQNLIRQADLELLSSPGTHTIKITYGNFTTTLTLSMVYTGLTEQLRLIYHQGLESGLITGTYEEWLDSIKGADGMSITTVAINEDGHLILTFSNDEVVDVGRVVGNDGIDGLPGLDGIDGKEIEFNINDTHIQWRYVDEEVWNNLVELDTLIGAQGPIGETGDQGLSTYEIYLMYFPDYEGDEEQWINDLINGNLNQLSQVIISFEVMDGDMPDGYEHPVTININKTITLPVPTRSGYEFMGWYTGFTANDSQVNNATPMTKTMTLYAKWLAIRTITFISNGGTSISPISGPVGSPVQGPDNPQKESFSFQGWFLESTFENEYIQFTTIPNVNMILYAKWRWDFQVNMVSVGEKGISYTVPIGSGDIRTSHIAGGYLMATTQTTYELWYEVRVWAVNNGYIFQNNGREGSNGIIGAAPTERKYEPVTSVSWRDVIVWTNALSDMTGFDPVYRTLDGTIIKNSTHANAILVDAAIQTNNNGYRLPTSMEWEMAARWRNGSGDGAILVEGRYWTPFNYASGATADYTNEAATQLVAWYSQNSENKTQPVGQKTPNHLNIYDMSGNVWEWTYTASNSNRIIRGGSFGSASSIMQISVIGGNVPQSLTTHYGFRMARNP